MSGKFLKSVTCLFLVMSLSSLHFPHMVRAEMIGVQMLLDAQQRADKVERTTAFLQREDVRGQMIILGVDPDEAQMRVEALSDRELNLLAQHIGDLPAAGDSVLVIIGILFLVLLILELVGVINVFSRF